MDSLRFMDLSQHPLHVKKFLAIISSDILSVPFSLLSPFHLVVLVGFDIVLSAGTCSLILSGTLCLCSSFLRLQGHNSSCFLVSAIW